MIIVSLEERGRALALDLAKKGVKLSVVDFLEKIGQETVALVKEEHAKLKLPESHLTAVFIKCDVTNPGEVASAFAQHKTIFGRLDICINSAGVAEKEFFTKDKSSDGTGLWRRVIDINLVAVIDCTRFAIQTMLEESHGGVILNLASAAGLYPTHDGPIYSSSKGGVVLFTRALSKFRKHGIRVNALCPEFVETPLTKVVDRELIAATNGFLPMSTIVQGASELIENDRQAGACLWISNRKGLQYWPSDEEKKKYLLAFFPKKTVLPSSAEYSVHVIPPVPSTFRKVVVTTLSNNFRAATKIVTVQFKPPVKDGHVLVKYLYVGVNASDVNFTSGSYFKNKQDALQRLPYDAGFEAVGIVAGLGDGVNIPDVRLGSSVASCNFGGFAEYSQVPSTFIIPVPEATPQVVSLITSGLTASLGLEKAGKMESGETALVTAAAGGTGQFAVQLLKLAGNKVVATCGGQEKALLLRSLGADRVIDYKKEDIKQVLNREFPKGVDLVYESVGGHMFEICLDALSKFGRIVVIGMVSQYQGEKGWQPSNYLGLCEKLLRNSQSMVGFFLPHYAHLYQEHLEKLYGLYRQRKLKIIIDPTSFTGLESVPDAVEYLHSGRSIGKVVVRISNDAPAIQQSCM
ncbi:hypothetical protein O6H91_06G095600 [Diphasiastrum complanatum]|uniref:Uncharacterized protein n=2 Tax=Diphasiastrum complanatum TaxID=34168 RepID=A0ACC2DGW5_DIPCM|nr:hypothetical protein O6H91_06G095600 [Diphasiastrum complanatum]KAJ7553370.1 hypothetical protein O6H91_06G095600 [Diphasiastrum complanatum]